MRYVVGLFVYAITIGASSAGDVQATDDIDVTASCLSLNGVMTCELTATPNLPQDAWVREQVTCVLAQTPLAKVQPVPGVTLDEPLPPDTGALTTDLTFRKGRDWKDLAETFETVRIRASVSPFSLLPALRKPAAPATIVIGRAIPQECDDYQINLRRSATSGEYAAYIRLVE